MPEASINPMCGRGWETNPMKHQATCHLAGVVRGPAVRGMPDYPSQTKNTACWILQSIPQRRNTVPGRPLCILEATYPAPRNPALAHTRKRGRLPALDGAQSRKGLCGIYSRPALLHGPYSLRDPVMLGGLAVENKMHWGASGKPQWENHNAGPWDSGTRPCHLRWRIFLPFRAQFLMGP